MTTVILLFALGCTRDPGALSLPRIEASQAVGVTLYADGAVATAEARAAPLLAGRDTWLLVWVGVDEGWTPTELEATLILEDDEGERVEGVELRTISRSTEAWAADPAGGLRYDVGLDDFEGFALGIPAERVKPGTAWHVDVRAGRRLLASAPEGELADLGVDREQLGLTVELQPIELDMPDCQSVPDTSEAALADMLDLLKAMVPFDTLTLTEAPPLVWDGDTLDRVEILNSVAASRAERGSGPDDLTYGILEPCEGQEMMSPPGGSAMLPTVAPTEESAEWMAAVLARNDYDIYGDFMYEDYVFVHELLHLLGRPHAACGDPALPDADYPYDEGRIGAWGLDPLTGRMHHPDLSRDLMAYCNAWWESPYTWDRVRTRLRTQAAGTERLDQSPGRVLLGSLGTEDRWQVVHSPAAPARTGPARLVTVGPEGQRQTPAFVAWSPDGDRRVVSATLPADLAPPWAAWLQTEGERHPVPVEVLR